MTTRPIRVDDRVRLRHDIGPVALHEGQVGVVCSIWHTPGTAYEVEFPVPDSPFGVRTLVQEDQLELVDDQTNHSSAADVPQLVAVADTGPTAAAGDHCPHTPR